MLPDAPARTSPARAPDTEPMRHHGRRPLDRATTRPAALAIGLTMTAIALAGCGASADPGDPTPSRTPTKFTAAERAAHSDIDIDFAQMMYVHTRQSAELIALANERSDRPDILQLAIQLDLSDTETAQVMTGVLESWGEEIPDEIALTEMDHSQMDHAGIGMGFMAGISDDQVTLLGALEGEAFDRKFLRFILTHRGAGVAMAQSERIYGQNGELTKIARGIESDQAEDMAAIQALLQAD